MAKSRSIGGIYASLSLRDGGFKSGLKSARKGLNEFGGTAIKGAAAGAAALGASMAAAAVIGTKSTLSMVDDLGDVAKQTGVAIADMMLLQRAYADGGRAAEMTGKDIGKMQKTIVGAAGGGEDPFSSMGLSAEKLLQLNPADQFRQIGDAIMEISNPAERTAKAMAIFGKGGMGLTTVFGGINGAVKSLGRMPALAQEFGAAMGEANDLIGHLPVKSDQFFTGFTAGIIGELLPGLQKVDDYDFTNLGQSIGKSLTNALDGTQWEIWSLKGMIAITKLGAELANSMESAATSKGESWGTKAFYAFHNMKDSGDPKWEKFKEKYGQNGEMMPSASAGNRPDNMGSTIAIMEQAAATLSKALEQRFANKQDAARDVGGPKTPDSHLFHPEDFEPSKEVMDALKMAAMPSIFSGRDDGSDPLSAAPRDVNAYQARGLSLSTNGTSRAIETQTTLLTNIRDILKGAKGSKQLNWT